MKYIICLLFTIASFCLQAQSKITYLKMERTPCFGRCPAYVVELLKDGTVKYNGKSHVEMLGAAKGKISAQKMTKFFKQLAFYKLTSLKNTYKPLASDLPRLNFSFTINGKMKSIKNAESGPKYLANIGKMVDSLIKDIEWQEVAASNEMNENMGKGPQLNMEVSHDKKITFVEHEPQFPGGEQAMLNFIAQNIRYPKAAIEANISGKVVVGFTVTKTGSIKNAKVIKAIGGGCDEEALRVIQAMPNWKPGTQNGLEVDTDFTIPVDFAL